jgi:uncharacterized protein (TIGR02996 family)
MAPSAKMRLEAALARWRQTRGLVDAASIEETAKAALEGWPRPVTDSARAFQRAWLAAVPDPIGRAWALDTLIEQLPGADAAQRAAALAKRVEVLARYGPDPRFLGAIIRIHHWRDVAATARLRSALARLVTSSLPRPPGDPPVRQELPPLSRETEALWREVHASPDDDAPLSVLADALQLAGDPRGELISLQLPGAGDEAARAARRRTLIASCGAAWLGRLASVTGAASFERGLLRRLELSSERGGSDPSWDTLVTDPMLATVTELLPGNVGARVYRRFITSRAMRSLRSISADVFLSPAEEPEPPRPSISHLYCTQRSLERVTAALGPDSALRSVAIEEGGYWALTSTPWFWHLTAITLGVGGGLRRALGRWSGMPRSMSLTLVPDATATPITAAFPWDFAVTLTRTGTDDDTIARVSGEWLLLPVDVLAALPPETTRVEVDHANPAMVDRVRGAIGRPGVEVVHRPQLRVAAVFTPTADRAR